MSACACRTSYLRTLLFKALLFLAAVAPSSGDCPKSCVCNVPTEVHCTFRYLTAIPEYIHPAVERINLGYNSITALQENDLPGFEQLELLMLHSNMIDHIEDRTFQDLKSLKVLKISFNKVKKINKETFKGLGSLLRLYIDHNHLEFISPEAFYGLTNLQLVQLEGNHLQQIHPDTFITLRYNQVFKVSSVRTIHLSDNLLTTLPKDIFSGCSHLENLFLHGNPWTCDCRMKWFSLWTQSKTGVLKCKRDRRDPTDQLCPVCQNPVPYFSRTLSLLPGDAFTCTKPWIQSHLKKTNISLDEEHFTPVSPKDFIAPLGTIQMSLSNQFHSDASLSCSVQRPSAFENLTQILEEEDGGNNVTVLTADITTYLVCNIDHEHIQQLWQILATYSDIPLRLERGTMVARSPEMVYMYSQVKTIEEEEEIYTHVEAEIKISPAWLMQEELRFQLDRTTTTMATLHIKYQSMVNLRVENPPKRDRYSWTMIQRDNQTKTEHTVIRGDVVKLNCQIQGVPKPLLEWILPDGSKVRAPYSSEDRRIMISAEGKLTVQGADTSDTGVYRCIATNYLDADVLIFRVTVLSPDVEDIEVNGVELSRPVGGNLILDCNSSGSPEASVEWVLPDHSVLDKSHGTKKLYENGTLLIMGLTERDRGFYRCIVANHLGVDLLISKLIVTKEKSELVTVLDSEGSGMVDMTDSNLNENTVTPSETPSSSSYNRIPSAQPYPRLGSQSGAGTGRSQGQRRRGPFMNRRFWSSRVFDKASRKVEPQKFAEIMKRAQDGSRVKIATENDQIKHAVSNSGVWGDTEIGSGTALTEDNLITPMFARPMTDNLQKASRIRQEKKQQETIIPYPEIEYKNIPTTEPYMQSDSTPIRSKFRNGITESESLTGVVTPYNINSLDTGLSNSGLERSVKMDSSLKTQIQLSGEVAEPETSTMEALSFTTDPNVTPIMDSAGPVDAIHFHSTQTIKSPHLPAGSTIISKQQIHIPPNNSRGGRRRLFQGRRRIIKPSRITNIQSFLTQLKQTSDKKNTETTAVTVQQSVSSFSPSLDRTEKPFSILESTASATNSHTTSDAPDFIPTSDPLTRTTTITTIKDSKVIRGKIPWNRLFGSNERQKILGKLKRPSISQKITTTSEAQTTRANLTTTPATIFTTIKTNSLDEAEILFPFRRTGKKEGSLDVEYEGFSSADFEFTTVGPGIHRLSTTSPSYYSRPYTTGEKLPGLQMLPSPPTVKPSSAKNEATLSESGGLLDNWPSRQRPGWTRGQSRRPFRGRRPINRPVTELYQSKKTKASTIETAVKTTMAPQHSPLYVPSRKGGRTKIAISSGETAKEIDYSSPVYTTTKTHLNPSNTLSPSSTSVPATMKRPYMTVWTKDKSKIRLPTWIKNAHTRRPPIRRIRPTMQSSSSQGSEKKDITLDTMTVFTPDLICSNTPALYSNMDRNNAYSNFHDDFNSIEATSSSFIDFKPTTVIMTSKPKIVGGNAASYTVLSHSDAYLPCKADGNPQPTIKWKRMSTITGSTVTIKGKMGKFEVLSNGTLSIQNANVKDHGQYLCLAENDHGSDKLLITLSVVAYPSRILEPKRREVKSLAGNTVKMQCKAEGRPTPVISWILANQTQVRGINTDNGRVSVTADGTLVIENVSVYDSGHYKCIANNPAGADTATVQLHVVAAPPDIMEEKRQEVQAGVSQNLWLPCTGQGSPQPTIRWVLHDGSILQSSTLSMNTRISVHENGTLHMKDVTEADSGTYECIATSSRGSERRIVILTVESQESAPKIVEKSQRLTELFFGDQLKLKCSATGHPKPRILWRLPSKAMVDQWHRMGSRIQVLDNGTLIVSTLTDKDAGHYLCVARSKIGDDLQLMRVSVSMKPAKIEPKLYEKKQVAYGNDIKVDCKASGAPKPEISWGLPDGTMVSSGLQSDVSSGGGRTRRYTLFDNGTLYLNQVGVSEEGDYTCYAENEVGKDEMIVHISVMTAPPMIQPPIKNYGKVKPGGNVQFDCEAVGEPKPKILWLLPTNDVIVASNERYLVHFNGSLDIRDVKISDAGEYVCMARNPVGETKKVYKLDVDGNPPLINGYQQNRTVVKDVAFKFSRKLIDCKAEGNPTPSITWIMPDNIFLTAPYFGSRINVHHNGTLEIRNVRPTDTADFICLAKNDGGESVMVVQLEVTSMPQRPIFKNPFNERIVSQIGKTVVLNCSADGHPFPKIIWTFPNGTQFTTETDRASHVDVPKDGTLVIKSRKEDSGKYRCGARNFMGYIEKLIILEVVQKPYILTRPRGIIRGLSGGPLFLHCQSDGSPSPRIYWTIPGGHTLTQPQVLGRHQVLDNGTLVIQDTTPHDRGSYICRARNDAGEAVLTVSVVIIGYPPRITKGSPSNVKAVKGTPLQLTCAAIGNPKPEITWELPDHSILSAAGQGRPMGSELLHPQGTLVIQRPSASDTGSYKCLAKNRLGIDSRVTHVHVV